MQPFQKKDLFNMSVRIVPEHTKAKQRPCQKVRSVQTGGCCAPAPLYWIDKKSTYNH